MHSVIGTACNDTDVTQVDAVWHSDEIAAFGDAGYQKRGKRSENIFDTMTWQAALKHTKRTALPRRNWSALWKAGASKSEPLGKYRASIAHPKNLFHYRKTRYRGLAKSTALLCTLFGLTNFVLARRRFTITESGSPS